VTYRQLDYWARTDLVVPSVTEANGSGTQRLYSLRDVIELTVVKQTLDAGLALGAAREVIPAIRQVDDARLGDVRIVFQSGTVQVVTDDAALLEALRDADPITVMVDMGRLVRLLALRERDLLVSA